MDWKKIQRVRELIERGEYIHSAFLNSAIETDFANFYDRLLRDIHNGKGLEEEESRIVVSRIFAQALLDLKECPKGKGNQYRDIVAEVLSLSLGEMIDLPLTRREFSCKGGRGDLELPVRIEKLQKFPLWDRWCETYKIRSIIVEVKNKKSKATPQDVAQILCYIVTANLGKFGILVSRYGFRESAMKQLRAISSTNEFLVLPFEQKDLEYLVTAHACEPEKSMEMFRQKATLLAQSA